MREKLYEIKRISNKRECQKNKLSFASAIGERELKVDRHTPQLDLKRLQKDFPEEFPILYKASAKVSSASLLPA